MFRQVVFFQRGSNVSGGLSLLFLTFGVSLVMLGILILLFPRILVAMIASIFIMGGAVFLIFAWKDWTLRRQFGKSQLNFWSL